MISNCGRKITRAPILVDGHSAWIHKDDKRLVCKNGDFAAPNEEKTFAYTERLIRGFRKMQNLKEDGELLQ